MKAVLPALARPLLEPGLPPGIEPVWFESREQAMAEAADAAIGWLDMQRPAWTAEAWAAGKQLQWISTIYAGLDHFDLAALKARNVIVTNGVGINALAVAEYAVMGVLIAAKRYDQIVRAQDAKEWPRDAPGKVELFETKALIIGYGAIGRLIGERLAGFGVEVTGVTRSGREGTITPDAWRARLGEYDWVILGAPSTAETKAMIGAEELAACKRGASIVNIARGDMIDQDALIAALAEGQIASAFLDVVHPEPLPPEHPLWTTPNVMMSMHMSGRSQTKMFQRAAKLFVENANAFVKGEPMKNVVDLELGY